MRSTNGPASRKRRKRWLKAAKGFWLRRSKLYRYAKDALDHGRQYAYRDRRNKKREFRPCGMCASMPPVAQMTLLTADLSRASRGRGRG